MTIKRALLATAAFALCATIAPAQADERTMYVTLGGGGNWLDDQTGHATNSGDFFGLSLTPDTGFVLTAAVGARLDSFIDGLRVEVEGSYRHNNVEGYWVSRSNFMFPSYMGPAEGDETTFAVLANAWWEFDIGRVHPYAGGGAGWARTELEGDYLGSGRVGHDLDATGDGFAWQLGGGINFDVSPNVTIGVGYRYFSGPDIDLPARAFINQAGTATLESTSQSVVLDLSFKL